MPKKENEKRELTVEESFDRLQEILENIDKKDISLKESFDLYKEGIEVVKNATLQLTEVEKQMIILEEAEETDGDE